MRKNEMTLDELSLKIKELMKKKGDKENWILSETELREAGIYYVLVRNLNNVTKHDADGYFWCTDGVHSRHFIKVNGALCLTQNGIIPAVLKEKDFEYIGKYYNQRKEEAKNLLKDAKAFDEVLSTQKLRSVFYKMVE